MPSDTLLHERYRLIRQLGKGGFAVTYLATDTQSGQTCVVKDLHLKGVDDWKAVELFEREAKVLAHLDHPQIPRYIDDFTIDEPAGRRYCLVQTYVAGENLAEMVASGRRFPPVAVVRIALAVLDVLIYLHDLQPSLIHRDIKPSNIILAPDGRVHLIDFGSVRDRLLQDHQPHGGGSTIVGTYGYMPFEQFSGKALPASDLYALGATMLYLLSHQHPSAFDQADGKLDYRSKVTVSDDLAAILDRLLAFQWQDRFQTAREARDALQALQAGKSTPGRRPQVRLRAVEVAAAALTVSVVGLLLVWLGPVKSDLPEQPPTARPEAPAAPALPASQPVGLVEGEILWDGQNLAQVTGVAPSFWFRDEETNRAISPRATYQDGRFQVTGLGTGRFGMSNYVNANPDNPPGYPGDFYGWTSFERRSQREWVTASLAKVIHLTSPFDNDQGIPGWNTDCHEAATTPSPVRLTWDAVAPGVTYTYTITRMGCPWKPLDQVTSGGTEDLGVTLPLPHSQPGEYYTLKLHALRGSERVGTLMTHGPNGVGWDLRFRVGG